MFRVAYSNKQNDIRGPYIRPKSCAHTMLSLCVISYEANVQNRTSVVRMRVVVRRPV